MKKWVYGCMTCALISLLVFQAKYFNKPKVMILETEQSSHAILTHSADPTVNTQVSDNVEREMSVNSNTIKKTLIHSAGTTLEERIAPPDGYVRVEKPLGSFQGYLRKYELKPDKSPVLLYDGSE